MFDFDETLIPDDSFQVLLEYFQIDVDSFINDRVQPLVDNGWDKYLARAYCLVKESHHREKSNKITKSKLIELGHKLNLYDGVTAMFDLLHQRAKAIDSDLELEFYLISGGFVDIASDWEHLEKIGSSQKLSNLVLANYQQDSEMMRSLFLAIDCIGKRIALGQLSMEQ
ncbi:MAG: hypothetical protein AAGE84_19025 [Cyanobacteria bacterium P01_G01_bin.39]